MRCGWMAIVLATCGCLSAGPEAEERDEAERPQRVRLTDTLRHVPIDRHRCDLNLPMIARRSNVPVYILASKRDIKQVIPVYSGPSAREVSSIAAAGVHTVVTDELARGFEHFFEKVYVVEDEAQFPRARYLEVRVKMRRIWTAPAARNLYGVGFGWRAGIDWAISLRVPPMTDYLFSLSDRIEGNPIDEEDKRLFDPIDQAIGRFFQRYVNRGVHEAIQRGTPLRPDEEERPRPGTPITES